MKELRGRTAVVTGAASGIGRSLAAALVREGCNVVLADIEASALDDAVAELRAVDGDCLGVVTDVSDPASVDTLAARTVDVYGGADILCNNAGVSVRKPLTGLTLADWTWVLGVDLWGVIHGLRSFLPLLTVRPEAHVVNTASVAGLVPFPSGGAYNAAKAAVVAISETLHLELAEPAPHVGVSVLCPGATRSNFVSSARNRPDGPEPGTHQAGERITDGGGDEALDRQSAISRALIENGMPPGEVAGHVVAAIRDRRFWVLTHRDEYGPSIRARTDHMLRGTDPRPVDIGSILAAGRDRL